ncbi:MAG: hypothetical protein HZA17_01610 [Nitrospirae bacterium]|nr:hypothetical protein [Nitrospirota bacterium]
MFSDRLKTLFNVHKEKTAAITEGHGLQSMPDYGFNAESAVWQTGLCGLSDELNNISRTTEAEFLEIGRNLQELSDGYMKNSSMATALISMDEDGEGLNVDKFGELFKRVCDNTGAYANELSKGFSHMSDLQKRLAEITELKEYLDGLSRSIAVVGILTRIETARLNAADFNSMTEVVDELAEQIGKSTVEITASADEASELISRTLGKMEKGLEGFRKEMDRIIGQLDRILTGLIEKKELASGACKRIGERTSKIIPETGEIVTALQYHDICRQRMDHVAEALADIAQKIGAAEGSEKSATASVRKYAADVIKVQVSQLENVIGETSGSSNKIGEHLRRISDLAVAQTLDAGVILDDGAGGIRIGGIVAELESLLAITDTCRRMTADMIQAVSEASDRIAAMSAHAANIVLISDNIGLLAINAIIRVARTGESGRALEVLADRIRLLSLQAKEEIEKGTGKIEAILKRSGEFKCEFSEVLNRQLSSTSEIGEEARVEAQSLIGADRSLNSAMLNIKGLTDSLKEDIARIIDGISFDRIIRTGVGSIISKLESVKRKIGEGPEADLPATSGVTGINLHELAARYTMESEREIHESAVAGNTAGAVSGKSGNRGDESTSTAEDSMGDNVELF